MKTLPDRLVLPLLLATLLSGLLFATVRQTLRAIADDPQVQIAEDAAVALEIGVEPRSLLPGMQTEVERSLSPFIAVYDPDGVPLVSSALLDGTLPKLPSDVLDATRQRRLTWTPEPGVRIALVVQPYAGQKSGFVAVGRSLRETGRRTAAAAAMIAIGWLLTVGAIAAAGTWQERAKKRS
ncbi:MAG: hypothetical protein KBC95_04565 [Candidatus Peribacteraceae bacterium]|nr:hypothetical protein [Candidatus Peribacteraceae bacterium]